MKPMKAKHLLSRFGEIGRIFLSPEDPKAYARRVRFGGNKKRNFDEGWVEFKSKKAAKLVAETLNTSIIGKLSGSPHFDTYPLLP
jgi:ESF2/ABP1 family protein